MKTIFLRLALIGFAMLPVLGQAQALTTADMIHLQARGEVDAKPDIAVIKIAVTTEDENAAEAISENARKMNQVVQVLEKEIKDASKIQTSRYQLNPVNQYDQETKRSVIVGYRVTNEVVVESDNIKGLGDLIDDVVEVGSNQIQQLSFSHSELEALQDAALKNAIANGIAQANVMAEAAGVKVVRVAEISTVSYQPGPVPMYREMAMSADMNTPILPGEILVSQQVNMSFVID